MEMEKKTQSSTKKHKSEISSLIFTHWVEENHGMSNYISTLHVFIYFFSLQDNTKYKQLSSFSEVQIKR